MKKFLLTALLIFGLCTPLSASLEDVIQATVRIQDGQFMGTGTVFNVTDDSIYILTNAHVAEHDDVQVQFYVEGQITTKVAGRTVWRSYAGGRMGPAPPRDMAIVVVTKATSPAVPKPIGLADRNFELREGTIIVSMGHPEGRWPTLFKTTVTAIDQGGRNMTFRPPAEGGRSGSGVFDEKGEKIVGLIAWRQGTVDGPNSTTRAMTIYELLDAWEGKPADHDVESFDGEWERISQDGWRPANPDWWQGNAIREEGYARHIMWHMKNENILFGGGLDSSKWEDVLANMKAGWNPLTDKNFRWEHHSETCHDFHCPTQCPPGGG